MNTPTSGMGVPPISPTTQAPTPTGIEKEVCADIALRQQYGLGKYPTTVEENPAPLVAWLQHAYEETLDHAIYLKKAIKILRHETTTAPPSTAPTGGPTQ